MNIAVPINERLLPSALLVVVFLLALTASALLLVALLRGPAPPGLPEDELLAPMRWQQHAAGRVA
ncbi:MAG: hypothetical protein M3N29_07745 [Chloroflexota bacterium]|nr:hypothetical protein [Chloroflexota bacterium]